MKYIFGAMLISFVFLFIVVLVMMNLLEQAPDNMMNYLGIAWLVLSALSYPIAKKLIRD